MIKNIITICVIAFNVVLVVLLFKKDNNQAVQIQDENYVFRTRVFNDYMKSMKYTGNPLKSDLTITDFNSSEYSLKNIVQFHNKLVFRYSYISCNVCIDTIMKIVNEYSKYVGNDKIIILSQYANKRDYKNFVRINNVKQPIYHLQDSLCRADELGLPYFFVINDNMVTNNFFLPRKEYPQMIKTYLESIKTLLY